MNINRDFSGRNKDKKRPQGPNRNIILTRSARLRRRPLHRQDWPPEGGRYVCAGQGTKFREALASRKNNEEEILIVQMIGLLLGIVFVAMLPGLLLRPAGFRRDMDRRERNVLLENSPAGE
jgi:hypothetical protein